jgi:hypothetical protein
VQTRDYGVATRNSITTTVIVGNGSFFVAKPVELTSADSHSAKANGQWSVLPVFDNSSTSGSKYRNGSATRSDVHFKRFRPLRVTKRSQPHKNRLKTSRRDAAAAVVTPATASYNP